MNKVKNKTPTNHKLVSNFQSSQPQIKTGDLCCNSLGHRVCIDLEIEQKQIINNW